MRQTHRAGLLLASCLLVFGPLRCGLAASTRLEPVVSAELLEQAGLRMIWSDSLPIEGSEHIDKLYIVGSRLYVLTNRNYLISLEKSSGRIVFARTAAPPGLPVAEPLLYDGRLISILGNRLVEMSEQTGKELSARHIEYGVVCPAARNSLFFYISGADRRLHAIRARDYVQLFEVSARGSPMITSILAGDDLVIFATDTGNVIGMAPDQPKRLWQFDAGGPIVGPLIKDGQSIFFACKDTNVYRLDVPSVELHRLAWKYQVPGVPAGPPRATGQAVYQYVPDQGISAIDRASGRLLWALPEAVELLAESTGRAFTITKGRKLVVMHNASGRRLYSVNFRDVQVYTSNTADPSFFIADRRGRIACVRPAVDR